MISPRSEAGPPPVPEGPFSWIRKLAEATSPRPPLVEVLHEILNRVRTLFHADTATILLPTEDGTHLVPRASAGVPEAVHQAIPIPVGRGFSGRIATERTALVLNHVDSSTVANPLLWEKGLRNLIGVPLLSADALFGILHLGSGQPGRYTYRDTRPLQIIADDIAVLLQNHRSHNESVAATVLQHALVDRQLPRISGMEFSARYVSAQSTGIGGDWYDVFPLPSGAVCFVVGDVAERGYAATMLMSKSREALRVYALDHADPAVLLNKLDRYIRYCDSSAMITIACGILDPSLKCLHLSVAGHPKPVFTKPGSDAHLADVPVDLPIGVGLTTQKRHSVMIEIPYGTTAVFYTDGLIDRPHKSTEESMRLLYENVRSGSPESVCGRIMSQLIGSESVDDDIALLAVHRQNFQNPSTMDFELDAVPESLTNLRVTLRRWLPTVGASEDDIGDLLVAVGEAAANTIEHAYGPTGGVLHVLLEAHSDEIRATISDTGAWRSPRGEHGGRGTELMHRLCDVVRVDSGTDGTTVVLHKQLSNPTE